MTNMIFEKSIKKFSQELVDSTPKSWLSYKDVKENLKFLDFNIEERKMYNEGVTSNLFYSKDGGIKQISISDDIKDTDIATKLLIKQFCFYLYNKEEGLGYMSFDTLGKKGKFQVNVKKLCGCIQQCSVDKEFPLKKGKVK